MGQLYLYLIFLQVRIKHSVNVKIILEWILGKEGGKVWIGFILLR